MPISTLSEGAPDGAAPIGRFIISLDCEGKWGMADHITPHHHHHLTHANLVDAYRRLVGLFARYDVAASFAFVLAFTLSEEERKAVADRLVDVTVNGQNWLRHYREAEAVGNTDGWFCPEALEMVRADSRHEIACHSFSHAPLAEGGIASGDAVRELESCRVVAGIKGIDPKTFVFPRNQIGHVAELSAAGFAGYRARLSPSGRGLAGKLRGLAAEFDMRARAQAPIAPTDHGMTVIPSGYFLNWQSGIRRAVPRSVSRRRWRHILRDAAESQGVAHIWLHPHNIIDGPGTLERLEDVLIEAARLRDAGRLGIVTQAEYCAERSGHPAP